MQKNYRAFTTIITQQYEYITYNAVKICKKQEQIHNNVMTPTTITYSHYVGYSSAVMQDTAVTEDTTLAYTEF